MTRTDAMKELKANGSAQARKLYKRSGVTIDLFGVSYAVPGKMKKKIKVDQRLAQQLWETANHDARVLATMIADPKTIDAWANDLDSRGQTDRQRRSRSWANQLQNSQRHRLYKEDGGLPEEEGLEGELRACPDDPDCQGWPVVPRSGLQFDQAMR